MHKLASYFGSKSKLAKALNISRHAVYKWDHIPRGAAYQIQVLTNNRFLAKDLLKDNE
jgi:DNA invertase Pin-like site-specific DNA recombinase